MRKKTPAQTEAEVLVASRRRCALCWGLAKDLRVKRGQIAHLDRNHANSSIENLASLCLEHHDDYDTKRSQPKGYSIQEVKTYRNELHQIFERQQKELSFSLELTPSEPALKLIEFLFRESKSGRKLDPQLWLSELPEKLGLNQLEAEAAVDEVIEAGVAVLNGTRPVIITLDRLFWSFDPLFLDYDPAEDAVLVAMRLMELGVRIASVQLLSELAWDARRLNPVINFLVENELVRGRSWPGSAPFIYGDVEPTARTRRFLKTVHE